MVGSNCYLQDLPETCACTPRTKTRPQLVSPSSILHVCLSKLEGLARVTHKTSSLSSIRFFDYLILFPFRFHAPGWFQHETLHVGQSARLGFLPSLSPSSSALSPLLHFFDLHTDPIFKLPFLRHEIQFRWKWQGRYQND